MGALISSGCGKGNKPLMLSTFCGSKVRPDKSVNVPEYIIWQHHIISDSFHNM